MSKEVILNNIRQNKAKGNETTSFVNIKEHIINIGDLYDNFKNNIIANKSLVHETTQENLADKIQEIILNSNAKKVMFGNNLKDLMSKLECEKLIFDRSINEIYNEAFDCDFSVVKAECGVSNFGILCLSSEEQPRLLSLLPSNCIVLLKKENIVENLNDAFELVAKNTLPTNIIFIIGPSRTSDIELELVLGVHGPQNVYVVLY